MNSKVIKTVRPFRLIGLLHRFTALSPPRPRGASAAVQ
jgi:hypothetical protein